MSNISGSKIGIFCFGSSSDIDLSQALNIYADSVGLEFKDLAD